MVILLNLVQSNIWHLISSTHQLIQCQYDDVICHIYYMCPTTKIIVCENITIISIYKNDDISLDMYISVLMARCSTSIHIRNRAFSKITLFFLNTSVSLYIHLSTLFRYSKSEQNRYQYLCVAILRFFLFSTGDKTICRYKLHRFSRH